MLDNSTKQQIGEREISRELRLMASVGYDGLAIIRSDQLVKLLGLNSADVMRKRFKSGYLPFLRKDEGGFFAHADDVAQFLAQLRVGRSAHQAEQGAELGAEAR